MDSRIMNILPQKSITLSSLTRQALLRTSLALEAEQLCWRLSRSLGVIFVSCSGTAQPLVKFPVLFLHLEDWKYWPSTASASALPVPQGRAGEGTSRCKIQLQISNPSVLPEISRWNFLFWFNTETQVCCVNFKSGSGFDVVFKALNIFPTSAHPLLRAHRRYPVLRQEYK